MKLNKEIYTLLVERLHLDNEDSLSLYEEILQTEQLDEKSSYELYNYYLWTDLLNKNTLEESFFNAIYKGMISLNVRKILCVGDGKYHRLSLMFVEKGFDVIAIDKSIKEQKQFKNLTLINKNLNHIDDSELINSVDVIVGHHPCEGAKEIILASEMYEKPFVTALCCAPRGYSKESWHRYLLNLVPEIKSTYSLSGKLLYKKLSL